MSRESGCTPTADSRHIAALRLILGQYRVQVQGRDSSLMAADRYDVAVGYVELRELALALIATIDAADKSEGCGDRTVDENLAIDKLRAAVASGDGQYSFKSQVAQRCRIQSDERYGSIHRLARSGRQTECGFHMSDGGWWVLGDEDSHRVTCRVCLRESNGGIQCDVDEGPCACGAWH